MTKVRFSMKLNKLDKNELNKSFLGIETFLFDMDGTIIQSEPIHAKALQLILKKIVPELPLFTLEKDFSGLPDPLVHQKIFQENFYGPIPNSLKLSLDQFIEDKNRHIAMIIENISPLEFKKLLIPGLINFLKEIKKRNFLCGLVSASEESIIHLILRKAQILDFFDIVTPRLIDQPNKPSPYPYLKTIKKLSAIPAKTIIFEDSKAGLKAAHSSSVAKVITVKWELKYEEMAFL